MSDHESEVSPEVESMNGSFSSNGNDPGANASAFDGGGAGQDLSFLDDLAKAMRSTAAMEQARDAELTEQRRQAHLDAIRAREALEAEELRELAKEDVKGIDAWSDGEIKRIKLERERRIASRREQLQVRLEEHRMVIASEVEAVEAALAAYRIETERFFDRLGSQTDPVEIARQAGTRPPFPALDQIGPQEALTSSAQAPVADAPAPVWAPDAVDSVEAVQATETVEEAEPAEAIDAAVSEAAGAIETPEVAEAPEAIVVEAAETAGPVETVETVEAVEAAAAMEAVADGSAIEPAAAEAEHHEVDEAPTEDTTELVGVMDPGAEQVVAESPWDTGVEAAGEPATVAEPTTVGETVEAGSQAVDGVSGSSDDSDEPVSVGAEARVVMPRTTGGAGSWLRWPNSSIDRSDPSR